MANPAAQCPLTRRPCKEADCKWFCRGEKVCSIMLIALELMKKNER